MIIETILEMVRNLLLFTGSGYAAGIIEIIRQAFDAAFTTM